MKRWSSRTNVRSSMPLTLSLVVLLGSIVPVVRSAGLNRLWSPGASTTLIISEVLYDPTGIEPDGEWIEIYNLGTMSLDLGYYKVGDEEAPGEEEGMMRFPEGASIAPAQAIVVANKATAFLARYGFNPDYEMLESDPSVPNMENYSLWAKGSLALHNAGDDVLLLDSGNRVVDALSWGVSTFAFSPSVPGIAEDHSLERQFANVDTDTAQDWIDQTTPDPGHVTLDLTVSNSADGGAGTLRWALLNVGPGEIIAFDPAVFSPASPTTILVQTALPTLTQDNVTLDASNAGVILDGSTIALTTTNGIKISGASGVTIKGLQILHFPDDGIEISGGAQNVTIGGDRYVGDGPLGEGNLISENGSDGIYITGFDTSGIVVEGNYIGVNLQGAGALGNADDGIHISRGTHDHIIGGTGSGRWNLISGNGSDGVFLTSGATRNTVRGNFIGTDVDGRYAIPNADDGVHLSEGAHHNTIGGTGTGEGNLISGNTDDGVFLTDLGTQANVVQGNIIGANRQGTDIIGQGHHGVRILLGASYNAIGGGSPKSRNLISGNSFDGVLVGGSDTLSNTVRGNYIGTNISGTAALPNGLHGLELNAGSSGNIVRGNLLSGNRNHGLIIYDGAHHNTVTGNIIGADATGTYSLGNQPWGGVDIAQGAHHNRIGGLEPGEGNLISGNQTDGIALFHTQQGYTTPHNLILGNRIGLALEGDEPLSNGNFGLLCADRAVHTLIQSNTIAYHEYHGVLVATCDGNRITHNAIYDNGLEGLKVEGDCLPAPEITGVALDGSEAITGTTIPNAHLEIFSDDEDEGRVYEGSTTADASGNFGFAQPGGFSGPNVTVIATDADGNTSPFSRPAHLLWTFLLYLNGDNDLEEYVFDVVDNIVAAGPSPRANVLALVDGYTTTVAYSGTILYDLTGGAAIPLDTPVTLGGERNMGDGQTLVDFVTWGRAYYPSRYTLLSILDHGGGWAPAPRGGETGTALAPQVHAFLSGGSGLSWDFTDGHDYLDSPEIRQAMAAIDQAGAEPLDVVFLDVCLMGLIEVAYQIHEYAHFFVSSQNLGWAPIGPQSRYVRLVQEIEPTTAPRQLAEQIVDAYADSMPERHPFTISAVDLTMLPGVANAVNGLAVAISDTLTSPTRTLTLHAAYSATQKLDYDNDLAIEPSTDGVVDLYDLALNASEQFTDANVLLAIETVTMTLDAALVAERHRSGTPWLLSGKTWELDDAHGLSIFLPLGEDLEFPISITETLPLSSSLMLTRNLRLRDTYACDQLQFVCDTAWDRLIDTYYSLVSTSIPTSTPRGPVDALLTSDVTPPRTVITVTGTPSVGQIIDVTWTSTDTQTGVARVALWHQPPEGSWTEVETANGTTGLFSFNLSKRCENGLAVRSTDGAGNTEPLESGANTAVILIAPCHRLYLPLVLDGYK